VKIKFEYTKEYTGYSLKTSKWANVFHSIIYNINKPKYYVEILTDNNSFTRVFLQIQQSITDEIYEYLRLKYMPSVKYRLNKLMKGNHATGDLTTKIP